MQTKRSAKVLGQPNSQITKPTVHRDLGKAGCHLLEPETFSPKSLPLVSEREPEFSAALIAAAVTSTNSLPQCLESVRLDRLVSQCLDMTLPEAAFLAKLPGVSARRPQRTPEGFYGSLHQAISECGLWSLFTVAAHAEWHRSIVPAAYNEHTGEIYPTEMAEWRADFRAMAPECQMVAATIVWLYRAGSDSIWLRRVPSAWRAVEALRYMRDADVLDLWLNLIVNYTGW
jgi:hypothetical protein